MFGRWILKKKSRALISYQFIYFRVICLIPIHFSHWSRKAIPSIECDGSYVITCLWGDIRKNVLQMRPFYACCFDMSSPVIFCPFLVLPGIALPHLWECLVSRRVNGFSSFHEALLGIEPSADVGEFPLVCTEPRTPIFLTGMSDIKLELQVPLASIG